MAGNARKKRKTESTEDQLGLLLRQSTLSTRHPNFWFEDGNVVVNSVDNVEFKLHASLLTYRSKRFKELIASVRQQFPANNVVGQTVRLNLDDWSEDLAMFFEVLFGERYVIQHTAMLRDIQCFHYSTWLDRQTVIGFPSFRSVTMLAVKYRVQHLIDSAVLRLRAAFPGTSLEDFIDLDLISPIDMQAEDCLTVVWLARACGAPDILPRVFYRCADLPHSCLENALDGIASGSNDGVISPDDIKTLLLGRQHLLELNNDVMRVVLEANAGQIRGQHCPSKQQCSASLQKILLKCADNGFLYATDCLESFTKRICEWAKDSPADYSVCPSCMKAIRAAQDTRRAEVFEQIVKMFGSRSEET